MLILAQNVRLFLDDTEAIQDKTTLYRERVKRER